MGVVAIFAAIAVMVYNHVNVKPNNSILAKNIEALSQSEDNTAGACCLNGYKMVWNNECSYESQRVF